LRSQKRNLAIIAALLFLATAVVGCKEKSAAIVNGRAIPESEITNQLDKIKNQQPQAFKGAKGKQLQASFRTRILDALINAELVKQEAESRGLKASTAEVKVKTDQVLKFFGTEAKLKAALKDQGMTRAEYEQKVKDQIISEKLVEKITGGLSVSDAELKDYYKKHQAELQLPAQIHVRRLATKTEAQAKKALAKINGGEEFAAVAKTDSIDVASKNNGGDVGMLPRTSIPAEALKAIDKLDIGQVSDVLKTPSGYEIYKLEEKQEAKPKTFEEVKAQLKEQLASGKKQARFQAFLETLKKKAKITKSGLE